LIGQILGNRYRILREIGSGGMAWVYLAEDINEGRLVAIKVLYPQFGEDIAYIQRFNREAKFASQLSDPHIVRTLDYGATRDVHYLVMEYIEGQDLRSLIDERGSLPWRDVLRLLDQLAIALDHAHQHNIVHRDIKPQNLMITADGTLKVLDFGIARARMLPSLTQSGFVGSPYYISPEQAMGEEVDIRSDIYSSGIVLYEALSGCVPYDATSPWSIISQHIASEPPTINLVGKEIPGPVQALMNRMIAKRPEDRFQTPAELREAIGCVLAGRPLPAAVSAPPPAVPGRVATAEGLYQRALEAIDQEDWQKAVDLLNQVIKLDANHAQAAEKLADAGRQMRLAARYTSACRAMEAGRWQEAHDLLAEVVAARPKYRDAAQLLDRARAAQETGDATPAPSPKAKRRLWLAPGMVTRLGIALRRVALALLALVVLGLVVLFFTNWSQDISRAVNLPLNPFTNAGAVRSLDQLFEEGQAAYSAKRWNEAIDAFSRLQQADATFRSADVQPMLCTAHLQRGQAQIAGFTESAGAAPIQVARKDFEAALTLCPNDATLSAQQTQASHFLNALRAKASEDWGTVIRELTPVVAAEPDYAQGGARRMLYVALVTRGDTFRQANDLQDALADYTQALSLGEIDTLDAAVRRDEAQASLAAPQAGQPPRARPTSAFKYPAPTLVGPEDGAHFSGEFVPVVLEWQPVGGLAEDEYYDVTVMHYVGDEPRYWGAPVKETTWRVPVEAGFGQAGNDRFQWWVTVRKDGTAPGPDKLDQGLSPASEVRTFYWY
jgi:tetratricopeptide (TPR) repeat protein/predicted Ser/Thr protein kinase